MNDFEVNREQTGNIVSTTEKTEPRAPVVAAVADGTKNVSSGNGWFTKFMRSVEGKLFCCGIGMALAWLLSVVILLYRGSELWAKILTMGFAHMLAGRAASVAQAIQSGLQPGLTVFLGVYFDVAIMFIIYSVLVFSYKYFLERRFFKKHMQPMFESAKKRMGVMRRFEIVGIFLFVWFPFWMTGVISGALLGFLMGLRLWVNMLTVISGTTAAMLCWVYAYDKLFQWSGSINQGIPMLVTVLIIAGLVIFRLVSAAGRVKDK